MLGELRPGHWAAPEPDRVAVRLSAPETSPTGDGPLTLTYGELEAHSRRLADFWFAHGLRAGDHVAILMTNRVEYGVVVWAAQRSGLYYTPVNTHLGPGEIAQVVADCAARWLVVDEPMRAIAATALTTIDPSPQCIVVTDPGSGATGSRYDTVISTEDHRGDRPEIEGFPMLYSSGTTGRPKGIVFPLDLRPLGQRGTSLHAENHFGVDRDTVYLVPGPLYHSAPLNTLLLVTRHGGELVTMPKFDAEGFLAAIARHRVTHVQVVPTMFVRLLRLPTAVRSRYDLSSLRYVIHAAAPCPTDVKRAMIDWLGPIVWEYYSSSEALGRTLISSEEWLTRPGSVGRSVRGKIHVLDADGHEVPPGDTGAIYFETFAPFSYHRDPVKTAAAQDPRGWSTMGDIGHVDDDGYLFLTGRAGDTIISGGVNVYPQEIEDVLATHPSVADCAVAGVADPEWGQRVQALVVPEAGVPAGPALEAELIAYMRERLAAFKCPRGIQFVAQLPRLPSGKLQRHKLPMEGLSQL